MEIPRLSVESILNGGKEPPVAPPPSPPPASQPAGFVQSAVEPYDKNLQAAVQGVRNLITVLRGQPLGKSEQAKISQEKALRVLKRPELGLSSLAQVRGASGPER